MLKLPPLLECIPCLHHSIYGDNITVWTAAGSDTDIQRRLQQAANIIATYAHERGLSCSPQKSKLFFYHSRKCGRRDACAHDI
ncbi:hypothetical protein HPB48_026536 [Haemaphysalis longicornis]|uniref:Tick transposon n=1 Tax=Haemaphysalis longicornis TaxID=44386 RepID=A0A9J6HCF3_HAELO|nr:hypothetical protein HPB48_026536 [Haemaphysalis longicornis]